MKVNALVVVWATSMAGATQAAVEKFDVAKETAAAYADEVIDADMKLYWGKDSTPAFVEITRPDVYTGTSISLSPFGGSRRHCLDAFQKSLKSLADTARKRGYDAIVDLRPVQDGKPADDTSGFKCSPGYKVTQVALSGSFAMSEAASLKALAAEQQSVIAPARKPVPGSIFLPIEPLLASEEAAAVWGPAVSFHWGVQAPAFAHREGPEDYSDDVKIAAGGAEAACRQAVLKVMQLLAAEAKSKNFDAVIKVRSHLNEQYAPALGDVECEVGKKEVSVSLQATLAQKK